MLAHVVVIHNCCVSGAMERQDKLRELGAQKLLQQLLSTSDTVLFDK